MRRIPSLSLFLLAIIVIAIASFFGPSERSLGSNVRLVYIHGAWVWTALIAFGAAAASGLIGWLLSRPSLHLWSSALGQAGIIFWTTYLPLSLWTMQANWNGLYLSEPRFRIGIDFAVIGILLQLAILIVRIPRYNSLINMGYFTALWFTLARTEQVMHPPSPILSSNSLEIQLFFFTMVGLCVFALWGLTHWLRNREFEI
ncbi:MAG TPA: hypothetical protein VMX56_08415 [Anaerolineales bacterium]|nr:hypothetical protein [Anaerolineales bacterium]